MEKLELLTGNLLYFLLLFLLIVIPVTFIIAVWKRNDITQTSKLFWMIFFVIAPLLSVIIYLIFGSRIQRNDQQ